MIASASDLSNASTWRFASLALVIAFRMFVDVMVSIRWSRMQSFVTDLGGSYNSFYC